MDLITLDGTVYQWEKRKPKVDEQLEPEFMFLLAVLGSVASMIVVVLTGLTN